MSFICCDSGDIYHWLVLLYNSFSPNSLKKRKCIICYLYMLVYLFSPSHNLLHIFHIIYFISFVFLQTSCQTNQFHNNFQNIIQHLSSSLKT